MKLNEEVTKTGGKTYNIINISLSPLESTIYYNHYNARVIQGT